YWHYAERKGYAGTAIFSKYPAINVAYGIPGSDLDKDGRVLALEFENFYFITCYTPNARRDLSRLDFRMEWDAAFHAYLQALDKKKSIILCGDLNVAHEMIDIRYAKANKGNSGFTREERNNFSALLASGFIDTFRYLYPNKTDCYSWWSY